MTSLANLIPSSSTKDAWVPRPASGSLTTFSGFTSPAQVNGLLQVGNIVYGMIAEKTGTYANKDVPFAYNLKTSAFLTTGIPGGAASLPATPGTTGDWTPPCMIVVGPRVIITHPGFAGGAGPYFGWLDISGFASTGITGSTHSNKTIDTLSVDVLNAGWQPGQTISGTGIPANTTIVSLSQSNLDLNTTGNTNTTNVLTGLASLTGVVPGATITGAGIPLGTLVLAILSGSSVSMTQLATSSATGIGINFSGGTTITISNAATSSNSGVAFTVGGGTKTAPLYGSGNTNGNPLLGVPVSVGQFNGRAWYAVPGEGMQFSDSLVPCNITNASQQIEPENGLDITAFGGLPITQTTGGTLQSLIAFQGDSQMQQITGDIATSNLSVSSLNVGVGTLAPNTICNTLLGLSFVAPDGLRILNFAGNVTEPIGVNGDGVCVPFLNAINPSRMCAAFNQNTLRISVKNGNAAGQPTQEYWYDFGLKTWSGPHSFPAALIQPYQGSPDHGFTMVASGINAELWTSQTTPTNDDTYTENGVPLTWAYETVLLPDSQEMSENKMVLSMLMASLGLQETITVQALDEKGSLLGSVSLTGPNLADTIWDDFVWGAALWGGPGSYLYQHPLNWPAPIIAKQFSILATGTSAAATMLGNVNMQIETLGYLTQAAG